MDGVTLNPYTSPVADLGAEVATRNWMIRGSVLWVQDQAVLPPVDLEGHHAGGPLTPVMIKLQGTEAAGEGETLRHRGARGYAAVPALRKRTRRKQIRSRLIWICAIWLWYPMSPVPAGDIDTSMGLLKEGLFLLGAFLPIPAVIALWIWGRLDRGVRAGRNNNDWYPISGVHPSALAALAQHGQGAPAPMRRYKCYRLYGYLLPLRSLVMGKQRRNPLMWLLILIFKSLRSPALAQRYLHWTERVIEHPSRADSEMKEDWRKKAAGTELESWNPRWAEIRDSLMPGIRSLVLVMASPDGRFFATFTRVRGTIGGILDESDEVHFFSWTADGRIIETASVPPIHPLPEGRDYREVKGHLRPVWAAHQRRAGEVAVPLRDDRDLRDRLDASETDRCAVLEAAGILGPMEEVELPWGGESLSGPPPMPKAQHQAA
jgi:hypothetical protein